MPYKDFTRDIVRGTYFRSGIMEKPNGIEAALGSSAENIGSFATDVTKELMEKGQEGKGKK